MIVLWIIVVIVILSLAAGAIFLSLQVKKIKHFEYMVREAFWRRKNKIPLLIETARKAGIEDIPTDEILDLSGGQSKKDSGATLKAEDGLFGLLSDIFRKAGQDISLLALKKEFSADQENIKIAFNNYTVEKARFSGLFKKLPRFLTSRPTE